MNTIKIISSTICSVLVIFSLVLFSACKKGSVNYNSTTNIQPCKDVICLNGGTCSDGYCQCAQGYEGLKCETKMNEKFIGHYTASDECDASSTYYPVTINADNLYPYKINIENIGSICTGAVISATITPEKTSFTIPVQPMCGNLYYSGTGNINANDINVFLIARDTIAHTSTTCSILLHK